MKKLRFSDTILVIGINPYVHVPDKILHELFRQAGKNKGPIPVQGKLNGKPFMQTVVKYRGMWRLYLNGEMRKAAGIAVSDKANVELAFDPQPRECPMPPQLTRALSRNKKAKTAYEALPPSRQKEIVRYLGSLKTDEAVARNVEKVMEMLAKEGKGLYR